VAGPSVSIDLEKIEANAKAVCSLCADNGISVSAVTKVCCGSPLVARALLRGGAAAIGESRLENCHRLRAGGIIAPLLLLRIPPLSAAEEIVSSVDMSLNSEIAVIRALGREAERQGRIHDIILMVDLGDLREGILPEEILPVVREILEMPSIRLKGIGTNLTCYGGVIPTRENLQQLVDHAHRIEDSFHYPIELISGGNSSSLPLLLSGGMPKEINHLRIGEAILLGRETVHRSSWPGTSQDAFRVRAEIIELKRKPSMPSGETGQDAFGRRPRFEDKGEMLRGILNIGREDVDVEGLSPLDPAHTILGASSDHLLVDLTESREKPALGEELQFLPSYSALLTAMTSSYVQKEYVSDPETEVPPKQLRVMGEGLIARELKDMAAHMGYSVTIAAGPRVLTMELYRSLSEELAPLGVLAIGPSPNLSGPLGSLLGAGEEGLSPEHLVLACIESAGNSDRQTIRRLGIPVYTMEDVDMLGIREVIRLALRKAASGTRGIMIRLDPRIADGGRNGLTDRETHLTLEMAARSGLLRGLDISGCRPAGRRARKRLLRFAASALGKHILG
jgi:ornithine racemase